MPLPKTDNLLLLLLRLGGFFCFMGWAWVHFYWEAPYGILLWQDSTFALADRLGIGWEEFVGSGANDGFVQKWITRIGWLYFASGVATLTARKSSWFQLPLLVCGSAMLFVLCYAKYVGANHQLPMLIEHGGQFLMPVILVLALQLGVRHKATATTALVATIMIFAGHGAYALGFHWPTPANFYGMTTVILRVESETAGIILRVAGVLDLLVCIALFFPRLRIGAALYAAVWGFLTALARPVAGMSTDLIYWGADQYIHETVLRAPHYLIPLYLLFLWKKPKSTDTLEASNTSSQKPSESPL